MLYFHLHKMMQCEVFLRIPIFKIKQKFLGVFVKNSAGQVFYDSHLKLWVQNVLSKMAADERLQSALTAPDRKMPDHTRDRVEASPSQRKQLRVPNFRWEKIRIHIISEGVAKGEDTTDVIKMATILYRTTRRPIDSDDCPSMINISTIGYAAFLDVATLSARRVTGATASHLICSVRNTEVHVSNNHTLIQAMKAHHDEDPTKNHLDSTRVNGMFRLCTNYRPVLIHLQVSHSTSPPATQPTSRMNGSRYYAHFSYRLCWFRTA